MLHIPLLITLKTIYCHLSIAYSALATKEKLAPDKISREVDFTLILLSAIGKRPQTSSGTSAGTSSGTSLKKAENF